MVVGLLVLSAFVVFSSLRNRKVRTRTPPNHKQVAQLEVKAPAPLRSRLGNTSNMELVFPSRERKRPVI